MNQQSLINTQPMASTRQMRALRRERLKKIAARGAVEQQPGSLRQPIGVMSTQIEKETSTLAATGAKEPENNRSRCTDFWRDEPQIEFLYLEEDRLLVVNARSCPLCNQRPLIHRKSGNFHIEHRKPRMVHCDFGQEFPPFQSAAEAVRAWNLAVVLSR